MARPVCQHCGSDVNGVDPTVGAHMICHVYVKHGQEPPYLGIRCPACDGTGLRPGAPAAPNVNLLRLTTQQYDALMDGLHCQACNQSGIIKEEV